MWIETEFVAINLNRVRVVMVVGSSIRVFCTDKEGDADIPFASSVQANKAYETLMAKLRLL